MWQTLLGFDPPLWAKFIFAFAVLLGLFSALFYVGRRFGSGALGSAPGLRGRQPRLAVLDAAAVDTRRKLVLIRRDNVEHLILIGGPTDVVIEPNIVRATPAASAREAPPARETPPMREAAPIREPAPIREAAPTRETPVREAAVARVAPTLPDVPPRAVPLADGGHWPLQPEAPVRPQRAAPPPPPPAPPPVEAAATEPVEHAADRSPPAQAETDVERPPREPALRAEPPRVRMEPPVRAEPPIRAEPVLRAVPDLEPAPRAERPPRTARTKEDRLAGLAADLSRSFKDTDLAPSSPSPPPPRSAAEPRRPTPPPVQPVASVQPLSEAEEQNLTEMAQRLESALQRPRPAQEPIQTPPPAPVAAPAATAPALRAVELPRIEPITRAEPKPPRPEPIAAPAAAATKPPAKATPSAAAKPGFTLEQEMASLLGRSSSGKT